MKKQEKEDKVQKEKIYLKKEKQQLKEALEIQNKIMGIDIHYLKVWKKIKLIHI